MHAFKFCSYGQQRQHSSKKTTSSSKGLKFESSRLQSGKKLRKEALVFIQSDLLCSFSSPYFRHLGRKHSPHHLKAKGYSQTTTAKSGR